jgi:hypothetical protein
MSQTKKKTDKSIKSLKDWVNQWPKNKDLGFNLETREPCIYEKGTDKEIATIPWRREGDTLVILSQPTQFSEKMVDAARKRYGEYREKEMALKMSTDEQFRVLEASLLKAWQEYRSSSGSIQDVLEAENAIRVLEQAQQKGKKIVHYDENSIAYTSPMPSNLRSIPLL